MYDSTEEQAIVTCAEELLSGNLIAFPTETVYGIGADAENFQAIHKIFLVKNRPITHPVIVHVASMSCVDYWAENISTYGYQLMSKFWPGPLTLVFKRTKIAMDLITGGQETIGIRCPNHPIAEKLISIFCQLKKSDFSGIAAPSANKFGKLSTTRSKHVEIVFKNEIQKKQLTVLHTKEISKIGIESTILDLSTENIPIIMRSGYITSEDIAEVIGVMPLHCKNLLNRSIQINSPGCLPNHYAPNTPIQIVSELDINYLKYLSNFDKGKIAVIYYDANFDKKYDGSLNITLYKFNLNREEYAMSLYNTLHEIDGSGYSRVIFQALPNLSIWEAIMDRIQRAANSFTGTKT